MEDVFFSIGIFLLGVLLGRMGFRKNCIKPLVSNSALSYIIDLEQRCKKANFAPFDDRVPQKGEHFVWDANTIKIAENWLKQHHPEFAK